MKTIKESQYLFRKISKFQANLFPVRPDSNVMRLGSKVLVGMLMIPKTCAYVWIVLIGFNAMKKG